MSEILKKRAEKLELYNHIRNTEMYGFNSAEPTKLAKTSKLTELDELAKKVYPELFETLSKINKESINVEQFNSYFRIYSMKNGNSKPDKDLLTINDKWELLDRCAKTGYYFHILCEFGDEVIIAYIDDDIKHYLRNLV